MNGSNTRNDNALTKGKGKSDLKGNGSCEVGRLAITSADSSRLFHHTLRSTSMKLDIHKFSSHLLAQVTHQSNREEEIKWKTMDQLSREVKDKYHSPSQIFWTQGLRWTGVYKMLRVLPRNKITRSKPQRKNTKPSLQKKSS